VVTIQVRMRVQQAAAALRVPRVPVAQRALQELPVNQAAAAAVALL
jgi:hypothetical protein